MSEKLTGRNSLWPDLK